MNLEDYMREIGEKHKHDPPREFKPNAMYDKDGDILEVFWEDVGYVARWVNSYLTLCLALDDKRIVGVQIWGYKELRRVVEDGD